MFPYKYTIVDISDNDEKGYRAIIPAFPNMYVVADSPQELNDVVQTLVLEEITHLKTKKHKIPVPDNAEKYSGTFTLRINPRLHRRISELAQANQFSTNKFVEELIEKGLSTF